MKKNIFNYGSLYRIKSEKSSNEGIKKTLTQNGFVVDIQNRFYKGLVGGINTVYFESDRIYVPDKDLSYPEFRGYKDFFEKLDIKIESDGRVMGGVFFDNAWQSKLDDLM